MIMKKIIPIFLYCLCFFGFAQKNITEKQITEISTKLKNATGKERVKWLDSLTTVVWRNPKYNFDSLAVETINFSIKQDTADVAAYHIVNRMNYYGGSKGDLETANKIFLNFEKNYIAKVKKLRRLSNFYKAGGSLYYTMSDFEKALNYYDKALLYATKTTDSQAIGEIYMGKGLTYYDLGKLLEASQNLQKSIPYFKATKSVNAIINVKNVMTSLYSENGFYNEAAKERNEAIALAKKAKHHLFLSQLYFNYATELQKRGKLNDAINYFQQALNEVEQSRYKKYYKPIYLAAMVSANAELNNPEEAQKYWNLIEKEERKNAPGETTAFYKEARMKLAFAKKNYKQALQLGQDYLTYKKDQKQLSGIQNAEKFLAKVYTALGNYKQANFHNLNYKKISDSITGLQKANVLSYYQTLYELEKKDSKITAQQSKISLLDAQNKIKNQRILFISLGLILTFITIFIIRSLIFSIKKAKLQKQFSRALLQEQEKERKRFSKELHDGIGQNLLLIKNSLTLNPKKTTSLIDKTIEEIRAITRNLHPIQLEKFGLTKAIENLIDDLNELTPIIFSSEIDNVDNFFPKEKEIYLYRIVQECFNNIIKHSGATAAKIEIKKEPDKVIITIQDNGSGFNFKESDKKQKNFGLKSLQERVAFLKGNIKFDTKKNKGTIITIISFK